MNSWHGFPAMVAAVSVVFAAGRMPGADEVARASAALADVAGKVKFSSGDYKGALEAFNKAISLDPAYATAYQDRGGAQYALGDDAAALADCNKALELDPKLPDALFKRAVIQM